MKITRILLGLGGTEYTPVAVRRSLELAQRHGAEITAVTVVDERRLAAVGPVPLGGGHAARSLHRHRVQATQERVRGAVEAFEESSSRMNVPYRVVRENGEPFSLMASLSRYHDVMVFGLRSVFDFGLGVDPQNTLARLVRAGVRPLIAVSREYREIRSALLAYSGSGESAKAIKRFVQSRLWPDVELRLLTCAKSEDEARPLLEDMAAYCRAHGFEVAKEHTKDSAKHGILATASEWNVDLIVLGNGSRNLLLNRILGGTTLHVVKNATRPLYLSQ